ncbi:hypothetical protein [Actinomadura miaoliensis]|uniref:Uncharacterized protein n=1 Tax=Actinomadura miaoliensis TaxID=430685 RepID=A0ABP7VMA6_9ACTN
MLRARVFDRHILLPGTPSVAVLLPGTPSVAVLLPHSATNERLPEAINGPA